MNLRSGFYDGVDLATFQAPNPHPTWSDVMVTYDSTSLADNITHKNAFLDTVPLLDNRRKNAANAPDYIFNTFHTDQASGDIDFPYNNMSFDARPPSRFRPCASWRSFLCLDSFAVTCEDQSSPKVCWRGKQIAVLVSAIMPSTAA